MQHRSSPVIDRRTQNRSTQHGPRTAPCVELARVVGQLDLDNHLFTGSTLAAAVNEFAASTGRHWRFDPAAPPALLIRALSKLSIQTPDAPSSSARALLDAHAVSMRSAA